MKITRLYPIICHAYRTNWVFVRVETDAGLSGVGEATLEYRETTVAEAIRELERSLFKAELHAALDNIAAVQDAVGRSTELLIEGHGRFDVATAVRIARALEPFEPLWFEEPVPPDNWDALLEVKRRSPVPIAAGERIYSRWEASRFLEMNCVDYFQPDVSHCGGIGELKKLAAMAEARHIALCPHNPSGPVANAATLQVVASAPNFHVHETMAVDVPWRKDICREHVHFEDGRMRIPDAPGLGVELDEEAIAQHPCQARDLRHYDGSLTDIRPPEAERYFIIPGNTFGATES